MNKRHIQMASIAIITSIILLTGFTAVSQSSATKEFTYKVTITNLTPGQPFTPPVLVTHSKETGIFTIGEATSVEIQAIAENGNNAPSVRRFGQ